MEFRKKKKRVVSRRSRKGCYKSVEGSKNMIVELNRKLYKQNLASMVFDNLRQHV
jgi:hypothetical protein